MALISCPECEANISSKAHLCPFCGFPMDEYWANVENEKKEEEERIKNEKKRIETEERKKRYCEEKKFTLFDREISLNENEKICAIVGAEIQIKKESIYRNVESVLHSEKTPSSVNPKHFAEYADYLVSLLYVPLMDIAQRLCERFLGVDSEEYVWLKDNILDRVEFLDIYDALIDTYQKEYDEYAIKLENAHVQYHDDYYAAGTPIQPINAVYSNTLMGLAGANISARLVNSTMEALTAGKVKRREEKAANKYYETVYKEGLIFDIKILTVLENFIDYKVELILGLVLESLVQVGWLFEKYEYPKGSINYKEFSHDMGNKELSNASKKIAAFNMLDRNPGDFFSYSLIFSGIVLNEKEITELLDFVDFFGYREVIKTQLMNSNQQVAVLLEEGINISDVLELSTRHLRTIGNRVFESIEEKEHYIREKKTYDSLLNNFLKSECWFVPEKFIPIYEKIQKLGVPKWDDWKEKYEQAINIGATIYKEIKDNSFVKKMAEPIQILLNAKKTVTLYDMQTVSDNGHKILQEIIGTEECDLGELIIVSVKCQTKRLVITTRRFYLLDTDTSVLLSKFTLNQIERVNIETQGFTTSNFFGLRILDQQSYRIFDSSFPKDEFEYLKKFALRINYYVKNNKNLVKDRLLKICANTSLEHLEREYLERQSSCADRIGYILSNSKLYDKSEMILKWTHQIQRSDEELHYLCDIIDDNKIGLEYIIICDRHKIVTDKAIYISCSGYLPSNDNKMIKFPFEEGREYYPMVSISNSNRALFICDIKNKKSSIYKIKDGSFGAFFRAVNAVNWVTYRMKDGEENLSAEKHIYCDKCNGLSAVQTDVIKICPICGEKLSKNGWELRREYTTCINLLVKYEEDQENQKSVPRLDIEHILQDSQELIAQKKIDKQKEIEAEEREKKNKEEKRKQRAIKKEIKEKEERIKRKENLEELSNYVKCYEKKCQYVNYNNIYEFRKRFKTLLNSKKSLGYDFCNKNGDTISKILKRDYLCLGDYILYVSNYTPCPIVVTDRMLYIEDLEMEIDKLQEIVCYSQISNQGKYAVILYSSNQEKACVVDLDEEAKELLYKLNAAIYIYRSPSYNALCDSNKFIGYCSKCGSYNVKEGIIKSRCLECGNDNWDTLFRNRTRKVKLEEQIKLIDDKISQCEKGTLFQDENEWLAWIKEVYLKIELEEKKNEIQLPVNEAPKGVEISSEKDARVVVESQEEILQTNERIRCNNCGNMIGRDVKFCNYCGKRNQELIVCLKCKNKISYSSKYCNFCGEKIKEDK